ncbi:MAG TPA: inositol monophosphatase [Bacteroidaceae bacterium]|nr:inositol monophosphatase [Bacteroidaceae bacterium]
MDFNDICLKTREAVGKAVEYIEYQHENRSNLEVEAKGRQNYVTVVDREAERILVAKLGEIIPEAGFIAEEGTSSRKGRIYNWIIDPIDGTTNFIHGVPPFAVSVALAENDEVVSGVIYEFGLREYFYSWKGGGAWMNGKPISVSKVASVKDALIATGFPYTNFDYLTEFMNSMRWFMKHSHGLRRMGSAATDIAYVACGRYDGFYEYGLNAWDIAAGILILKEAGGAASDFKGQDNYLFGGKLICSNGLIQEEFVNAVNRIMETE